MSFPPYEIIKEKVFPFQVLFIMHSRTLKKTYLYKPKNPFPGSFHFLVLLSIIPSVHGCYSRINRIKFEIPKSMTAKKSVKNTTVLRTVTV
jgi:hypothetical protein